MNKLTVDYTFFYKKTVFLSEPQISKYNARI